MARITVEDCLEQIPNRFQLVLAATYRARMLSQGHTPRVESKNKPGVTALREIAAGKVGLEMLKKSKLISTFWQAFLAWHLQPQSFKTWGFFMPGIRNGVSASPQAF